MEAERKLEITLVLSEEEANKILYGLEMGRNHIRDHIWPGNDAKQKPTLDGIYKIEDRIREVMNLK